MKIKVGITDIDGVMRCKYLSQDKFDSSVRSGLSFCGVVFGWDMHDKLYDDVDVTGWDTGYSDLTARIDTSTKRSAPWNPNTEFYLMDFPDCPACPRALLRNITKQLQDIGYDPMCAFEYEWFNFKETSQQVHEKEFQHLTPLTQGNFGYSGTRLEMNQSYSSSLFTSLPEFNVPIEAFHTETGPGVYEVAIPYCRAVEMADRAVCFKMAVKEIAANHGITPTFMAKIDPDLPGCGAHIHQSLAHFEGKLAGKNAFYDPEQPHMMSTVMQHFLAGQLYCLPKIMPLFAPNINSYKRLVEGMWAPTKPSWGLENRTSTHRVIQGLEGTASKAMRIECRVGGADINPYLALAASLASGLYGITHKLALEPEAKGNIYADRSIPNIPGTLKDAVREMEANLALCNELFGEAFTAHYIKTRKWEVRQFQLAVTDYERKRYLEAL